MKTILRTIQQDSRADVFRFYPGPDKHLGNAACDEAALTAWIKTVADDEFGYWIDVGDMCDFINRKDPRFSETALPKWLWGVGDIVRAQRERYIDLHLPIAAKCLAIVRGNHEDTIYRHTERDVYAPIVEAISQAAGGTRLALEHWGFVRLVFHRSTDKCKQSWTLDIFMTHGWWGGALQGNGSLQLERLAGWVQAQVILAGHDHKLKTHKQLVVRPTRAGKVEHVMQVCGSCGAFLNGAEYAERAGLRPTPPGYLIVTAEPDKHGLKITM